MPPNSQRKSRKLSRKDMNQLKEYGELDPFSNLDSQEAGLDDLISKAISKGGYGRLIQTSSNKEKTAAPKTKPVRRTVRSTDSYTKLLNSVAKSGGNSRKRMAITSDDENEESSDDDKQRTVTAKEPSEPEFEIDQIEYDSSSEDGGESDPDSEEEANNPSSARYIASHFLDQDPDQVSERLAAVAQKEYKQQTADIPLLGPAVKYNVVSDDGSNISGAASLIPRLEKAFDKVNAGNKPTKYQQNLLNLFDQYRDVAYAGRIFAKEDEITTVYALHAMNHIFKAKDLERTNREKLKQAHADGTNIGDLRDQGFTRPRVLIILPFRSSAYRVVEKLIRLGSGGKEMDFPRFTTEYGPDDDDSHSIFKRKPEDFQRTFGGNVDDAFRIGLQLYHNKIRPYADFYHADIIVASPIGLRMATGTDSDERKDFDFLSSIEIAIVDQCDALLMQNWEHLLHVMNHLNLTPKKDHGCDFSRVRSWFLEGMAKHRRQTILISDYMTPELQAVFGNHCRSVMGKTRIKPNYTGAVADVIAQVPQVFTRIPVKRLQSAADDRFTYFTDTILPELEKSPSGGKYTLLFVSSYFDFVRVRNYCRQKGCIFKSISEYSTRSEAMAARHSLFKGELHFILYSERAHFFFRYPIKGVRNLIFYSLPEHPVYYSEMVNLMLTGRKEQGEDAPPSELLSCTALYTKYDQLKVERIVGSNLTPQLLGGDRSQYTFA